MSTRPAPAQPQASASLNLREVFYAAYGSNLSAERFACYIGGGTAAGASRALPGARDRRPPESAHALRLPGRLSFRGHSSTWGGAPAIFEPATHKGHGGAEVFARVWRLGWRQLEDVMAQENGRATIPLDVESAALVDGTSMLVGPGRYDRLVCVGIHEGLPVLTFTAPASLESVPPEAPSLAYLAHIITGLRETFGLVDSEVVEYLGGAPGATPGLVRAALAL
jgi:hypothetical protein